MNDEMDDLIGALLREEFAGPVPDGGFCDRVMDRLPRKRNRGNAPLIAGTLTGVATCWLSLRSAPIMHIGWQDWLSGTPSASAITLFTAAVGLTLLALAWTVSEAGDRYAL